MCETRHGNRIGWLDQRHLWTFNRNGSLSSSGPNRLRHSGSLDALSLGWRIHQGALFWFVSVSFSTSPAGAAP
jgi:hypothetical protein